MLTAYIILSLIIAGGFTFFFSALLGLGPKTQTTGTTIAMFFLLVFFWPVFMVFGIYVSVVSRLT